MQRRRIFLTFAVAVFLVGTLSRTVDLDSRILNKYLGDACYAVMFYVGLGVLFPHHLVRSRVWLTSIFVIVIECFQLTGVPYAWRQQGGWAKLVSILLGTKFSWYDMLAYFVGIASIAVVDATWIHRGKEAN